MMAFKKSRRATTLGPYRWLLLLSAGASVWGVIVILTGGFELELAGHRLLSSTQAARPFWIAAAAFAVHYLLTGLTGLRADLVSLKRGLFLVGVGCGTLTARACGEETLRQGAIGVPRRATYVAAGVVLCVTFVFIFVSYRFLLNDHYMHLAWAQQLRLGALPGRDFVDPGFPLQYVLSALAQVPAQGPGSEKLLTSAFLALAAATACVGVSWLTGSTVAGVAAATVQVFMHPRLYSYPKILVPALMLVLGLAYARRPGRWARLALAGGIAAAFLFRHDLGGYAALFGIVVTTLSSHAWWTRFREGLTLATMTLLLLLPYLIYLQWAEGLPLHVHRGLQFFASEASDLSFPWPTFDGTADGWWPWSRSIGDAEVILFYLAYALPPLAVCLLLAQRWRLPAATVAVVAGTAALGVGYAAVILRNDLEVRIPDLAAVVAILGSWCCVELFRWRARSEAGTFGAVVRGLAGAGALAGAVIALSAVGLSSRIGTQLTDAGIMERGVIRRFVGTVDDAREWPWPRFWPVGDLPPLIEYVRTCTAPTDRILVTWFAPEYFFFAQRGFAAGHAFFVPPSFSTPSDQIWMLARLDRTRVPLAILNKENYEEFAEAFPLLDQYLGEHYEPVSGVTLDNGMELALLAQTGWRARSTFGEDEWPCELEPLVR